MGCSYYSSLPKHTYEISYCDLESSKDDNTYKIKLISKEEVKKRTGRKFFEHVNKNKDKEISDFCKRENFEQKTIFYLYTKETPEIKNLYQMINLIPKEVPNLHHIFLLSTEKVKDFPNNLIEKKTKKLIYIDFIGYEIDLNDMEEIYEDMNYSHITKNYIIYDDNKIESSDERLDEIYINGPINKGYVNHVKLNFLGKKELIKVYISEIKIVNIKSFIELIHFFYHKDIKVFSIFNTNYNDFDDKIIDSIIKLLEKNYHLRSLDLHNINLKDNNLNDLIRAISDKRIRYLDLRKNNITKEGATIISEFLRINKTLIKLDISNNNKTEFNSEGIKYIISGLITSPSIKYVDFSDMNITGCGEHISDLILDNNSLESLILKNNDLNKNDYKNIFEAIKICKSLKEIDISHNDINDNVIYEYIKDGIKSNVSLVLLRIDDIKINDDNYKIIFEGIENNKHISKYSFCYNPVKPKIVFEFFINQKQVKKLRYLPNENNKDFSFENNEFIEKCQKERPDLVIINF